MRQTSVSADTFARGPVDWEQEGLLLAVSTEHDQQDSIIVVPDRGYLNPGELGTKSRIDRIDRNPRGICGLLDVITMWSHARVRDTIGAIRRYNILRLLHRTLYGVVSDFRWTDIEQQSDRIRSIPGCVGHLRNGLNMPVRPGAGELARDMANAYKFLDRFPPRDRAEYMSYYLEKSWNCDYPKWLAEFLMRLASSPESIKSWVKGPDMLQYGIESALRMSYLLRVARMFVIAIHKVFAVETHRFSDVPIYAGWNWDY